MSVDEGFEQLCEIWLEPASPLNLVARLSNSGGANGTYTGLELMLDSRLQIAPFGLAI